MFSGLLALFNLLYFALHISGGTPNAFLKPFTPKEEQACLAKIRQGDEQAKNSLIEHNLRLVAHIVKKYYASTVEQDDLLSIGTIGLIRAASTFDYDKGTRFATYAARCIENAILSQIRLWFQTSTPRAVKTPNGVFWQRFPRIYTFFVPLRTDM